MICEACRMREATDKHHIVSRGAGGVNDEYNILHLCRQCHTIFHARGWVSFGVRFFHLQARIKLARETQGKHTEARL